MSARRVVVRAPAKVNLSLAVLGRRPDGFHELDTVLMALELGDVLEAVARDDGECRIAVAGPAARGVPADATNLAVRAAQAVFVLARSRGSRPGGVELRLEKHVPAAAGLGGGSSDAAAAALACAELAGLDADDPELVRAVAELGSDCAFFLAARRTGLARCTGRGERVEVLPALALPWSLAVVTPAFGCATARVYQAFAGGDVPPERPGFDPTRLAGGALAELRRALRNDLGPAAERAYPELARFRRTLEECAPGAFVLAGSGSSWFGFFEDARSAEAALARVDAACRARDHALRGRWVLAARSAGLASGART